MTLINQVAPSCLQTTYFHAFPSMSPTKFPHTWMLPMLPSSFFPDEKAYVHWNIWMNLFPKCPGAPLTIPRWKYHLPTERLVALKNLPEEPGVR